MKLGVLVTRVDKMSLPGRSAGAGVKVVSEMSSLVFKDREMPRMRLAQLKLDNRDVTEEVAEKTASKLVKALFAAHPTLPEPAADNDLPKEVKAHIGKTPDGFIEYCLTIFPKLLPFAYIYTCKKKWKLHMK